MTLLSGIVDREELRRHAGDDSALVLERPFARHRRRRADALEPLGRQPLAHAAHEQRDVGALAAAVRVQLVEHEEPQTRAVADDLAIELVLTGHQELEHHEVGEQDVGRVLGDLDAAPRCPPGRCSARR